MYVWVWSVGNGKVHLATGARPAGSIELGVIDKWIEAHLWGGVNRCMQCVH